MNKKKLSIFLVLFTVIYCTFLLTYQFAFSKKTIQTVLYWGSSGSKVTEVQRKLKQWGYYDGSVDGVYGSKTYSAVRKFQSRNGLKVDGVIGNQTAAALGITLKPRGSSYTSSRGNTSSGDVYTLARGVYSEARGEPYEGQVAVAAVILNRVESPSFPNTIAGVIYQPGAFTAVSDGQINLAPDETSIRAARDAMNGWDPSYGCIYYYNPAKTTNAWIWSRPVHIVIGKHRFAK